MKFYYHFLNVGLLAGAATAAQAQAFPRPPMRAALDTVAVTGTTRVLTLAAAPGPELAFRVLNPGVKMAVLHRPPAGTHEYDITAIRVLVSKHANLSSTGLLLLNLALLDSSTHAPSARGLLPAPIVLTDREVRRAKDGVLTLDVRAHHLTIPASGVFVVAEGAPEPPYQYLGDTTFADHGPGKARPSTHTTGQSGQPRQGTTGECDGLCLHPRHSHHGPAPNLGLPT